MLKILNSQSKTITGAAIILSAATLLSRFVGITRDRVLAHFYGAGPVMDAYYAAFKIPDVIYNLLIVGALTAGFIPTFTKLLSDKNENKDAWKLTNNILNILGIALIVLCGLGMIFTPILNKILAPGFNGENLMRVTSFTRIMFLSPFFLGVSMLMGGALQSLRRFVLYAIAPIFYNFGIIFGATVLVRLVGENGLAYGVVLGAFIHCALQVYGAHHSGWKYAFSFNTKDRDTQTVFKLMVPRTLGLAITQLNQVVVTMMASFLPVGSIAVYSYANNLQAVPVGVFAIPFALAIFPLFSESVAQKDISSFVQHFSSVVRQILFLIIPATILILLLRAQIVRVILGSGQFDWNATISTADALACFALGLIGQSLVPVLSRAFFAFSNTKTPFVIGVISELISIIAALLLMKPLGAAGLALATSIGVTVNLILLWTNLRSETKTLGEREILPMVLQVTIASFVMGIIVQLLKYPLAKIFNQQFFWGIFGQGVFAGGFGILFYGIVCYFLQVPEFMKLKNSFECRWLKIRNLNSTEIIQNKE
ncbi:MAG: murein biosynthesis integral membrane protein MurJ [Candidatus Magasanikbacteria bacterium]|nr:murein biosynthesis integral membrane protein MurJ [Candidatus Magasanikbacteria bacterium]